MSFVERRRLKEYEFCNITRNRDLSVKIVGIVGLLGKNGRVDRIGQPHRGPEDLGRSIDNRKAVMAVTVDLTQTFDSINHNLPDKLTVYGLFLSAIQLMTSYLRGNTEAVGEGAGTMLKLFCVCQGRFLHILLFNIIISVLN